MTLYVCTSIIVSLIPRPAFRFQLHERMVLCTASDEKLGEGLMLSQTLEQLSLVGQPNSAWRMLGGGV